VDIFHGDFLNGENSKRVPWCGGCGSFVCASMTSYIIKIGTPFVFNFGLNGWLSSGLSLSILSTQALDCK